MTGIMEQFSNAPQNVRFLTVTGTGSIVPFGSNTFVMMRMRARSANSAPLLIYASDSGAGAWQIAAGDDTGWIPGVNMNRYQHNVASGDILDVWMLR